jgi:hypothetical protein
MKKVIVLGFALAVAVTAIAVSSSIGAAQVRIVQQGCDTLSFDPPRVHVPFAVINLSSIPVCSVHLTPIPSGPYPPCEIFQCSHPAGWGCATDSSGAGTWRTVTDSTGVNACIAPFQKLDGFDIILDPPYCCYRAQFDGPDGTIFYTDIVCFQCESPVPTRQETWGSLKARYR